ncbi:MAG: TraB/GumN family protein [Candidatus ainarchaeum sp.]|nr:TraB/GumN family protein [Candidatus ainarchaeum sp.]
MIKKLVLNDKEIILIGTAHISKESVELVEKTIQEEKPDVVGVELDNERLYQLMSGKKWQQTNIIDVVKTGKTYLFLLNILLSNLQKQLGAKVGVQPGSEMMIAVKKAQEHNIPIQLLDRNINITLKRAFKTMKLKEKLKLGSSIIMGFFGMVDPKEAIDIVSIEDLKNEDLINKLMKELGRQMPSVKKVLVDERDDYITEMIRQSKGKKIIAVVGAGHLNGIVENLKKEKKINLQELNIIPKKINYLKYLKYAIPLIFFIFIGFLFITKGIGTTTNALVIWFLANGTCSAIGAILAKAHPISVITAFLAAPFTSLHPAIAAGWITAITETKFNSPKVIDFENLSNVSTIKGFYQNKVSHILIVTALTNLGSMIGTIIAVPYLIILLA